MSEKRISKTEWLEYSLDHVVGYFSKDFTIGQKERILSVEHFIDSHKGIIVFKVIIEAEK